MDGPLAESPMPCKVCPNCSGYYLAVQCASCGWTEPDDDDDDDPDATPLAPMGT